MSPKRDRLASVLKVARHREDKKTAAHHARLREIDDARQRFIEAQHRAQPEQTGGSIDELKRLREIRTASAKSAIAAESHLRDQLEQSVRERNEMLAAMRYRRTVERIDDKHKLAWATLAAQAADRAMDDIAVAAWQRRQQ